MKPAKFDKIYAAIVGQDREFLEGLARAAIRSAIEVQTGMIMDMDHPIDLSQIPDRNDVTNLAADYTIDMLKEMQGTLATKIRAVDYNVAFEVAPTTTVRSVSSGLEC